MHVVKRVNSWFYQERFALQDLFQRVPITRGLLMLQASLGGGPQEEKKRHEAVERRQGLEAAKTHVVDSPMCGLALPTALEEKKRQEAAERRQGLEAAKTHVVDSPMCGLALPTALSRKNHLKKCTSNLDVETDQLLSAVKRQEEKHSTDAPADLARMVMDQSPTTTSRMTRLKNPESDDLADEQDYETTSMVGSSSSEWLPSDPDTHDSDYYVSDSESIRVSESEESVTDEIMYPMLSDCVHKDSEPKSNPQPDALTTKTYQQHDGPTSVTCPQPDELTSVACAQPDGPTSVTCPQPDEPTSVAYPQPNSECTSGGLKRHCCMFCQKLNTKMSTHLTRCHALEPEVSAILKMRKGHPDRRNAFIKLQDEGDYHYNCKVLRDKEGPLIPKYRKRIEPTTQPDYRACPHCKAIYRRQLLSKHELNCPQRSCDSKRLKKGQCAIIGRLLLPLPPDVSSSFFANVLSKLKKDDIGRIVMADSLILRYGERLYSRRDCEEHTYGQINGRLRELGRLCLLLRKNTSMQVANLTQAIDPANFDAVLKSVRELGEFDQTANMYSKGALVMKIGYSLKKCAQIMKAEAIKTNDNDTQNKCERFEALYSSDWFDVISASASQSIGRARMNKTKLLPSVKDVEKVNCLLEKDMRSDSYVTLAKSTLASVTVFNRKRGGEVQRMKLSDYERSKQRSTNPPEEELLADLTETEKKLVNIFHRVEIRGKFNRAVPILLTPSMVESVESLIAMRSLMDLHSPYLFITATGQRPYRGPRVLQEYANAAQVSDASLFTATTLRKQLATLSQAMAISELDQDMLATFLGHDLRIHRSIYRQTLDVVQKTKVASFLLKVNQGVDLPNMSDVCVNDEVLETEQLGADDTEDKSEDEDQLDIGLQESANNDQMSSSQAARATHLPTPKTTSRRTVRPTRAKRSWTEDESKAVQKHLSHCFVLNRVPQKHECEQALASEPVLKNRKWTDIKFFVYNLQKKKLR
ncbi:uncharacterized protein [Littorina saxatilis]|uniref:uncharacterized protein n=1 Tax=Littorina saxatilis TaxID=31220 RepID=UPI0038B45448